MSTWGYGNDIVVREVWRDMLWSARPARVVADDGDVLSTWCPAGTRCCFATSRYFPGREDLPRDERQLVSLESGRWQYRGAPTPGGSLTFLRRGRWSSAAPSWYPDGRFAHVYVNFQRPIVRHGRGYDTLDLVLDIVVTEDGQWGWKDREPFARALDRGIFSAEEATAVEAEADIVQEEMRERSGPFDPVWRSWCPPSGWGALRLPDDFAADAVAPPGAVISLDDRPPVGA